MVIKAVRTIEQGLVSSTLSIDTFGSDNLTSEQERQCLMDWPIKISYDNLIFSRFVTVDENHDFKILDVDDPAITGEDSGVDTEVDADRVTLAMDSLEILVDENFALTYTVDAMKLRNRMSSYKYIPDEYCLAKIMVEIFEKVVTQEIIRQFNINKEHLNDFETEIIYPI